MSDELSDIIYKAHKAYWGDYVSGLGLYEKIAQAVRDAGYEKTHITDAERKALRDNKPKALMNPCATCGCDDLIVLRTGFILWVRCVNGGRIAHKGYDGPPAGSKAGAILVWNEEQQCIKDSQ